MMDAVRGWLTAVAAAAVLVSVAESLVPEGSLRALASFLGGLVLLVTLARPLTGLAPEALRLDLGDYAAAVEDRRVELESAQKKETVALIGETTQAYILDKAASLGLDGPVRVTVAEGPDGVPRPESAEMGLPENQELAEYLERDLGIPPERQAWNERD